MNALVNICPKTIYASKNRLFTLKKPVRVKKKPSEGASMQLLLHTFLHLAGHPNVGAHASRPSCACVHVCATTTERMHACMHAFQSSCIRICAAGTTTRHFAFGTCDAMRCTHAPLRPLLLYFDRPGRSDPTANPNPTDACMHHTSIW